MIVIKKPSIRKCVGILSLFLIPLIILFGIFVFKEKRYGFVSFIIALLTVLIFISGFDKKKTGSRRLVIASLMTALSSVGRFIPFFKPISAFSTLSGIYFGKETGFLVGSMSALISNFWFGQGPWTPFQMLAFGMIGFAGGVFSSALKKSRVLLIMYGVFCGFAYSCIMDVWTVLCYSEAFDASLYLHALATALPHTILYCVSNALFLGLAGKPFGEKFERISVKYGV